MMTELKNKIKKDICRFMKSRNVLMNTITKPNSPYFVSTYFKLCDTGEFCYDRQKLFQSCC